MAIDSKFGGGAIEFSKPAMTLYSQDCLRDRGRRAYTLAEVLVTVFLVAVAGISLYAGFSSGFQIVQNTRENLRATQIMMEWMETSRLYTWSQIKTNTYFPPEFKETYDPNNTTNKGTVFVGFNTLRTPTNLPVEFASNVLEYTITVWWTNGSGSKKIVHSRQMQTYYARYGLQNYVFVSK